MSVSTPEEPRAPRAAGRVVAETIRAMRRAVNDEAVHGIPGRLRAGDLVKLDVTAETSPSAASR